MAEKKQINDDRAFKEMNLDMITQTEEIIADKKDLIHTIELLSDKAILQAKGYIQRLREEEMELEEIDAEIARLRAKYGTIPNAETIAAMKDAEDGLVEPVTLDEIRARCNAIR